MNSDLQAFGWSGSSPALSPEFADEAGLARALGPNHHHPQGTPGHRGGPLEAEVTDELGRALAGHDGWGICDRDALDAERAEVLQETQL